MSKRQPPLKIVCAECGVEFMRHFCHVKRAGRGQYCSKKCQGLGKRTGSMLYCAMCDSPFYRHRAEQDIGVKVNQFCSRQCYEGWRAANRKADTYPKSGGEHVHRVVAAAVLGRPLLPDEVVHHIDLDKHNSRPSNLAVFPSQAYHARCHAGGMPDDELRRFSLQQAEAL